jgi:prepilin peptidase CpaA
MLATILLLGLVLVATGTDLARHKIYNWTTYCGTLAAWGLSAAGWLLLAGGAVPESRLRAWGWISVPESLLGVLACGLLMLICFAMFKIGGGDVKLIAMLGAFLGPEQGITVMLWTFVCGACAGLSILIWRVGPARTVVLAFRRVAAALVRIGWLRIGLVRPLREEERAQLQPPLYLAPSALAAVVMVRFSLMDWLM